MLKNKFLSFIIFAITTYLASFIGGVATYTSKEPWYSSLTKASFNPPDWVFAPVWTTLYLIMTIAIWSAWQKNNNNINLVYIYLIHLFFNTTWSIVFFVFHNIFLALISKKVGRMLRADAIRPAIEGGYCSPNIAGIDYAAARQP